MNLPKSLPEPLKRIKIFPTHTISINKTFCNICHCLSARLSPPLGQAKWKKLLDVAQTSKKKKKGSTANEK